MSAARAGSARAAAGGYVRQVAAAAGVDPAAAGTAFGWLTRETFREDGVWPSSQLSILAGGAPLEFSVGARPALRLTTEVGDPLAAPAQRLRSGLAAVRRTAHRLGLTHAWDAAGPALRVLADPALPVPQDSRFWLWAGLDLPPGPDLRGAVLKAYLSLHAQDLPGWQDRERTFLRGCGIPDGAPVHAVLDRLQQEGWCHEAGVGLGADGRWGVKVYYELDGYREGTVSDVLRLCGLDPDPRGLAPEIPGVLRTSLAARSRAGIALRVLPGSGAVTEVTVAAAFPLPLAGREVIAARVQAWLDQLDQLDPLDPLDPARGSAAHARAVAALAPGWAAAPSGARMHSLFTRSRRRSRPGGPDSQDSRASPRDETKVYLRPYFG